MNITKLQKAPVEHYPNKAPEKPLVSVCVQTYQHADFIKQCLDGILMQKTNFDFEILLGEDESTDGTREICIEYAEKYPDKIRLFLHKRENVIHIGGHPTGRFNMLYNLNEARGKYTALCEGDDYWTDPLKLQRQVDFLEKHAKYSAIAENAQVLYDNGDLHLFGRRKSRKIKEREIIYSRQFATASILFRNNIVKQLPDWFITILAGDTPLMLLLQKQGPIYYFNKVSSVYRRGKHGMTSNFNEENYKRLLIEYNVFLNNLTNSKYSKIFEKRIAQYVKNLPEKNINNKNFISRVINKIFRITENYFYKYYLKIAKPKQLYYFDIEIYSKYKWVFYMIFG